MDRVPPHDEDAEVAVLGGMIQDPDQVEPVRALLGRRDFYRPAHGHVFEAILEEHAARSTVDLLLLRGRLEETGRLEEVGGVEYLSHLVVQVPSAASTEHYARVVRTHAARRSAITAGHELIRMAQEGGPLGAYRARVDRVLTQIEAAAGTPLSTGTAAQLRTKDLEPPAPLVGDRILAAGHLLIVVGDGGAGKSWLTLELAVRLAGAGGSWAEHAIHGPLRVLYLGAEETEATLLERLHVLEDNGLVVDGERFVYWCPGAESLDLQDPVDRGRLEQTIRAGGFQLVVGDPLAELRVGPEANPEFLEMFRALRAVRARTGAAMLFTHHTSKRNEHVRAGDGDRARGGTALRNCADAFLVLEREGTGDRRLMFYSKLKHGPEPRPAILEPHGDGGFLFTGRVDETRARRRRLEVPALLDVLGIAGTHGLSVLELVDATGVSRATLYRTVEPLLASGEVLKWRIGKMARYGIGPTAARRAEA